MYGFAPSSLMHLKHLLFFFAFTNPPTSTSQQFSSKNYEGCILYQDPMIQKAGISKYLGKCRVKKR